MFRCINRHLQAKTIVIEILNTVLMIIKIERIKYVILIAFPRQQWLLEIASMLRNKYTARLGSPQMEAQK